MAAAELPYKTEDEFERFIQAAGKEIFPEVFLLHRQVRAGRDIPDMVGVDRDNYAVIIENKNVPVDEEILPQIMRYAVWADTHQGEIKAWWLEAANRPDEIRVDWDRLQIRLIVLAPSIKPTVPRLVAKLGYPVELMEVRKFEVAGDEIIVVNQLEPYADDGRTLARGMPLYNKEFYKERRNPRSVEAFFDLEAKLERVIKSKGWNLEPKFNAEYAGFKFGFFIVFAIQWLGTKTFGLYFRIPKGNVALAKRLCPYASEYYSDSKRLYVDTTDALNPKRLIPLMQLSYDAMVGEHPAD